jgi:hypothetical protein
MVNPRQQNSSTNTDASVKILEDNASATGIVLGRIYYGPTLALNYHEPTVDPRTPDIIVTPQRWCHLLRQQSETGRVRWFRP